MLVTNMRYGAVQFGLILYAGKQGLTQILLRYMNKKLAIQAPGHKLALQISDTSILPDASKQAARLCYED